MPVATLPRSMLSAISPASLILPCSDPKLWVSATLAFLIETKFTSESAPSRVHWAQLLPAASMAASATGKRHVPALE